MPDHNAAVRVTDRLVRPGALSRCAACPPPESCRIIRMSPRFGNEKRKAGVRLPESPPRI